MDEFSGGRILVYKSDGIFERRRRILREARRMIAEGGIASVGVRELCSRAGIAQKTLYNAFGSKENVIALAIRQYVVDFAERVPMRFEGSTIEGRLERLIKVHSRNLQIRRYTMAIMAVYNSPTANREVRDAIRDISDHGLRAMAARFEASGSLLPGVTPAAFVRAQTSVGYGVLTDWCLGELPDERLVDRMCEVFLILLMGTTQGEPNVEAQRWADDLRGRRPAWTTLFHMVAPRFAADP